MHVQQVSLVKFAWLSVAAAIATIALKTIAFAVTGSVGLLSDAAESVVNLVAAIIALVALRVAAMPADDNHHYGHGKAEYFSAGIEGMMIFVAAAVILYTAAERLLNPQPLESLDIGLIISAVASVINGLAGWVIFRAGKEHRSATLIADGKHLFTDVWTSAGVIVGVFLVKLTSWQPLDAIVAILVGLNILATGYRLVVHAMKALLDAALPADDIRVIEKVLAEHAGEEIFFCDVRTRESGRQRFVTLTVQVPGSWSVSKGHACADSVEQAIAVALPGTFVETHLEPHGAHDHALVDPVPDVPVPD